MPATSLLHQSAKGFLGPVKAFVQSSGSRGVLAFCSEGKRANAPRTLRLAKAVRSVLRVSFRFGDFPAILLARRYSKPRKSYATKLNSGDFSEKVLDDGHACRDRPMLW